MQYSLYLPRTTHKFFNEVIKQNWVSHSHCGNTLYNLQANIKQVKKALKSWNKDTFGNVHQRVFNAQDQLVVQEYKLQNNWSIQAADNWRLAKTQLQIELEREESLFLRKIPPSLAERRGP